MGSYDAEMDHNQAAWLQERSKQLRERWHAADKVVGDCSGSIKRELAILREIDWQLPFAVLTVLLEHEMETMPQEPDFERPNSVKCQVLPDSGC